MMAIFPYTYVKKKTEKAKIGGTYDKLDGAISRATITAIGVSVAGWVCRRVGRIPHQGYFHRPVMQARALVCIWSGHLEQILLLEVVNYYHTKARILSVENLLVFGAHVGYNA